MALSYSEPKKIGTKASAFDLPGVDGKNYSLTSCLTGRKACVIMFICNHCPYVKAYFDRLIALANDYQKKEVSFVGINPNDEKNYPEDSLTHMITLAKEKKFPFPYLRDKTQTVAKSYDAVCTPEIFVIDGGGTIRYHGGIDDNWKEPAAVTKHFLNTALNEVLAGKTVTNPTPHAMGCSIKWS